MISTGTQRTPEVRQGALKASSWHMSLMFCAEALYPNLIPSLVRGRALSLIPSFTLNPITGYKLAYTRNG